MNVTEKAAHKLVGFLFRRGVIVEKEQAIYSYLLQLWLEKFFAVSTVLLLAMTLHMLPESLVFFLVFIPLRSYAGGLHLETYAACYAGSVLSFSGVLLAVREWGAFCPAACSAVLGLVCLAGIRLLSPVESGKRLISEKQRRQFARNLNIVLALLAASQLLLAVLDGRRYGFLLAVTEALQLLFLAAGKWKYRNKPETGDEKRTEGATH